MDFVTGASGLVGSHLVLKLIENGQKVKALIRSEESKCKIEQLARFYNLPQNLLYDNIEWVSGDILNPKTLDTHLDSVNRIYHCAALVSFNKGQRDKLTHTNVIGTREIVNICLRHKIDKLVYISSVAAIKSDENQICTEVNGWPTDISSDYSKSKTDAEHEVWRGIAEGLNAVIINPSIIIGPSDWKSGSMQLFKSVYRGMKYYTKGQTGFVDVKDVIKACIVLMESKISGERFIINGENMRYKELFEEIALALDVPPPKRYAPPRLTEIAWRIEAVLAFLLCRAPKLTKQTSRIAHKKIAYSSEKIAATCAINIGSVRGAIHESSKYIKNYVLRSRTGN